ncbi:hypothetical protein ACLHDG_00215 [Sulfurovum sp. CS9]|uniref:hypothetical protein n=1 Tax=Sulfurovum sp. CS9 TaxID=3391146 RepID=UPI0039EB1ECB
MNYNTVLKYIPTILTILGTVLFLSGCADQPSPRGGDENGFFMGLFHGIIMPFSLIGSFIWNDVRIYAFPNAGIMYDVGYVIGVVALFGSGKR